MPFDLNEQISKESAETQARMRQHLDALTETLQAMPGMAGCSVRNDSRLAWSVLQGKHRYSDQDACAEMALTQTLYADGAYAKQQEEQLRAVASALKGAYPAMPWTKVWVLVRQYATSMVKLIAATMVLGRSI